MKTNNRYPIFTRLTIVASIILVFNEIQCQDIEIYNHFHVILEDGYSEIQCLPTKNPEIELSNDKTYCWYNKNMVHNTQGGFSGYLLHGPFERYSVQGDLLEKGEYTNGLKSGRWTKWQFNGRLLEDCYYQEGELHGNMKYYDQYGEILKTVDYKDGRLNGNLIVYKTDTVFSFKKYRNGKLVKVDGKPLQGNETVP